MAGQTVRIPHHAAYGKLAGHIAEIVGPVRVSPMRGGRLATVTTGERRTNVWVTPCWLCSWLTGTRWASEVGDDGHAYCIECAPETGQQLHAYAPTNEREHHHE